MNQAIEQNDIWNFFYLASQQYLHNQAIIDSDFSITYSSLINKILSLSQQLSDQAYPVIGLLFNHSYQMVIAMLSCLKEHKIYVPLSPQWPSKRQKDILEVAEVSFLITDKANLQQACLLIPNTSIFQCEDVFFVWDKSKTKQDTKDSSIAYILFTSGSTGVPKGVMQTRENLYRHIRNYIEALDINHTDRLSLFSSYTFDAALMDIYSALMTGARLVLYDILHQGTNLIKTFLFEKKITILHCVPTLFRTILSDKEKRDFPHIRYVVLGGEEVVHADLILFQNNFKSSAVLINGYGPTECTTAFQKKFLAIELLTKIDKVSIGKPLPGIEYELIPDSNNPNYGELVISSDLVAVGYLKDPLQTQKKFIEKNFKRCYCTGDLFTKNKNQELVFVGRQDSMIKVNGVLVDLLEVQSQIRGYPGVDQAIVVHLNGTLIGCIVSKFLNKNKEEKIQKFLMSSLPTQMVPHSLFFFRIFPKTSTGKVDRLKLQQSCKKRLGDRSKGQANEQLIKYQLKLKKLWEKELRIKKIKINDHFYKVGGCSLKAINLIIAIKKEFKINFSIVDFILHSTIAKQTRLIASREKAISPSRKERDIATTSLLSFEQQRYWSRLTEGLPSEALNITYSINIQGKLVLGALKKSLNRLIRSHWMLQVGIVQEKDKVYLSQQSETQIPFLYRSIPSLPIEERQRIIKDVSMHELNQRFDLAKAPLMRFALLDFGGTDFHLLVTAHHLIVDGWSMQIILKQIFKYYVLFMNTHKLEQFKCCTNYYGYIQDQQRKMSNFSIQKKFWVNHLQGAITHHLLGGSQSVKNTCNTQVISISEVIFSKLKNVCKKCGSTLFNALLLFFRLLIWVKTNHKHTCVTTDWLGREEAQYKNTIGLFTNVVPLSFYIDLEASFIRNLISSQQLIDEAFSNLMPLPVLLESFGFDNLGHYHKLFPYAFVMQTKRKMKGIRGIHKIEAREEDQTTISRDVILEAIHVEDTLCIKLSYREHLFTKKEAECLLDSYQHIMERMLNNPTTTLSQILFT
jgi:amino acid adenylation domain-containing protein